MESLLIPGNNYLNQEQFDQATKFNQRYDFYNCTFDDIKFSDNVVIGKFENCRFNRCTFENFDGTKINLSHSTFADCKIISSNFENAYFEGADIYHSEINNSNFKMANFSTASIRNTEFKGNDLSSVLLYGATLNDVVMKDTVIQNPPEGLYLEDIYLDGATHQELEARQQEIVNQLRIEPISSTYAVQQAQEQLEPLPSLEPKQLSIENRQTVVVNCFAGPGAGKTTCAWEIASELKKRGIEAEYVSEYAKELVWDNNTKLLDGSLQSQKELYDIQNHRVQRLLGKVDVVVTDSPAIMGIMYLKEPNAEFEREVISNFKTQHNFNLFINRGDSFQQAGRIHNLEESKAIDTQIQQLLEKSNIYYGTYEHSTIDKVIKNIQTHLEKANNNSFSIEQESSLINEHTQQQFEIVSKYNPAPNEYQTWIRSADEIKSFEDALKISDYVGWETDGFDESYSARDAEFALKSGKITIYSSHPIKQGVFVTPSPMEAKSYSSDGTIYSKEVFLDEIAWIDPTQGQYANVEEYKLLFPSEIDVKCEADHWLIVDKLTQKELTLPSGCNNISEMFLMIAQDHPEYREFINNNFDKLIDDIAHAERAISNEAISVEHDRLAAAISQGGFGEDMADSAAYHKLQRLKNQMNFSNEVLESKVEPEINKQPNPLSKETIQPKQSKALTKEEFDNLTAEIKDIAKTYQADPDLITDYLAFKAQFYQYSPTNAMLIHLQNPYATFVASFTKWKELGYSIKKGQHHIKIARPIEVSKFPRNVDGKTQWTNVKYASPEEKAKIANGELEIKKTTRFIPHQVFDISQTDCPVEDYPKFYNMGHPDMEQQQLYECVKEYAKECGFTVQERDLSSISLHGYYDLGDNSIHINSLLEDSERLRTMCHELAHGVLHKTSTQPVEIKEFEAECFSAMLKRKMGFPVSEESKRYIKQYYNKSNFIKDGKFDMSKTLNRLSKTFNHISKGIDTTISNMGFSQDRELAHTLSQANNKAVDVTKISENFMQALS